MAMMEKAAPAEEFPCYEVSEEEFSRLMKLGALECPLGAEADDVPPEYYEISEEEFERLMRAGQISPAPQNEGGPGGDGDQGTEDMPEEMLYELSDELLSR